MIISSGDEWDWVDEGGADLARGWHVQIFCLQHSRHPSQKNTRPKCPVNKNILHIYIYSSRKIFIQNIMSRGFFWVFFNIALFIFNNYSTGLLLKISFVNRSCVFNRYMSSSPSLGGHIQFCKLWLPHSRKYSRDQSDEETGSLPAACG